MKLEYFTAHGRGLYIRMAFEYSNTQYEDYAIGLEEFGKNKAQGKYKYGQIPMLELEDGTELYQTQAILRYLGKSMMGKNGEPLYPGNNDPMLMY